MSAVEALKGAAIPLTIIALIYFGYRLTLWQDRRELDAEARYRQRMADRYYEMEFMCDPVEPRVFDWEQADATEEAA